jgi:hypothetical protein
LGDFFEGSIQLVDVLEDEFEALEARSVSCIVERAAVSSGVYEMRGSGFYLSNFAHKHFPLLLKVRLLGRAVCSRSTICRHVGLFWANVWTQERVAWQRWGYAMTTR